MISDDKIEKILTLADRIASKYKVDETRFIERFWEPEDDDDEDLFPKNIVTLVSSGQFGKQRFVSWLPISRAMYEDPEMKEFITARARDSWHSLLIDHITSLDLLQATPKGRLPA